MLIKPSRLVYDELMVAIEADRVHNRISKRNPRPISTVQMLTLRRFGYLWIKGRKRPRLFEFIFLGLVREVSLARSDLFGQVP